MEFCFSRLLRCCGSVRRGRYCGGSEFSRGTETRHAASPRCGFSLKDASGLASATLRGSFAALRMAPSVHRSVPRLVASLGMTVKIRAGYFVGEITFRPAKLIFPL